MNILEIFFTLVFVQGDLNTLQHVQNMVMNKITTGDYFSLTSDKKYSCLKIKSLWEGSIEVLIDDPRNVIPEQKLITCWIKCENKSVNEICIDFDEKVASKLDFDSNDSVFLRYEEDNLNKHVNSDKSITMGNIIDKIIERNNEKKDKGQFYFENIYSKYSYMDIEFEYLQIKHQDDQIAEYKNDSYVFLDLNSAEEINRITFRINIENTFCFFEFSKEDLTNMLKSIINKKKILVNDLCKKICELFEISEDNFLVREKNITIFLSNINIEKEGFKLYQENDDNQIEKSVIKNPILLDNCLHQDEIKSCIDKKCLNEFKEVNNKIMEISDTKQYKEIEAFYFLIHKYEKINFLIKRILNRPTSKVKRLFTHLLIISDILNKNNLSILFENEEGNEKKRSEIINYICERLSDNSWDVSYLIKICLLIEAERYINENDASKDILFITLKDIGYLISSQKSTKEFSLDKEKRYINLMKIMKEIVDILSENFNCLSIYNIIEIISLFSGTRSNFIAKSDTEEHGELFKDDIIKKNNLDVKKVEKINELVSSKLFEKYNGKTFTK
ncbi:uncharacterized protein VNE69_04213 [Vairimorpha necatrix]|uniref:Uncharacterized protein n=1 Tax=Vairimorpha necatrix TaxID=6039 RepID=A0AAX4JBX9_9MICR